MIELFVSNSNIAAVNRNCASGPSITSAHSMRMQNKRFAWNSKTVLCQAAVQALYPLCASPSSSSAWCTCVRFALCTRQSKWCQKHCISTQKTLVKILQLYQLLRMRWIWIYLPLHTSFSTFLLFLPILAVIFLCCWRDPNTQADTTRCWR